MLFDADIHRRQAEREVAELKQKLLNAEQITIEARENTQQHEKNYFEDRAGPRSIN